MSSPSGRTTVGVVGAGQLARMMLPAAIALDVDVRLLAAGADESAARVWPEVVVGSPDSSADLDGFAAICDVLTFDHELVDPRRLAALEAARHCLRPSAATQRFAQDKGFQRSRFAAAGLPVPEHALVTGENELLDFVSRRGWPVVLKTRRGGYDGRGVWIVHAVEEARELLERAAAGDGLVVERWLPIERELAVLIARRPSGESVTYPVVETVQVDGICHEVIAPAAIAPEMAAAAEALAGHVATLTNVTGILAVELFLAEGRLSINEVAVRPHNSGHFSI